MGSFILEMPMGVLSVSLPTQSSWERKAPAWAKDHWQTIYEQLEKWCKENKVQFFVEETAVVYRGFCAPSKTDA
jgi:hypothetical protein